MELFSIIIILGIIEGLTEFIPVSSTGHLILFASLFGFEGPTAGSFQIFIQLGAILAVVVLYRERFMTLAKKIAVPRSLVSEKKAGLNIAHIVLTIMPAMIAGVFFYTTIKNKLFNNFVVAIGLIAGGIIMIIVDNIVARRARIEVKKETIHSLDSMTYKQAFAVGIVQCFSFWPGVSRAGATIIGGVISGLDYKVAAEYSFIVAVPVMVMAVGYDLLHSFLTLTWNDIAYFILGGIVSFIVAMLSIKVFIGLVGRFKLKPFGWYRIALGLVVLWLLYC